MSDIRELSVVCGAKSAPSYTRVSACELRRQHREALVMLLKKQLPLSGGEVICLRKRMHWSQQQLAEKLSIAPSLIRGWEEGERVAPAIEVRFRLCCANHIGITLNIRTVLCSLVDDYRAYQQAQMALPRQAKAGRAR